jgi:hypothetical protein
MTGSGTLRDIGNAAIFGSATARTGGDIFNVNGFGLTIDQDTRYGLSGTTSTSLGNLTISGTAGGSITIDGRYVRLIPFNAGSGTITAGSLITLGSATAKVIGLYSSLTSAPALTGVSSGYLKVTEWNGVPFPTSGTYTQAGFTFTLPGFGGIDSYPGWIEVVGDEASTLTAYRLGTVSILGAWYDFLGTTTTGTRTSTYQIPTNGSLTYVAGVWVQSASATITGAAPAAGSITFTAAGHGFFVGQEVSITGASPSGYNLSDVVITAKTPNTFTVTAADPGTWTSGGSASVYEFYPNAGSRPALVANIQTDEVRGKWCWITTAGLVYFGSDGTNSTGGYIVPAGRKLRVPNVFLQNCTTAARTANVLPNATLATRYDFTTTGGGALVMDKVSCAWYMSFAQAYSVSCKYVSTFESLTISETASPLTLWDVGVGQAGTANTQIALNLSLMFAGGTIRNCTMSRIAQAASGAYIESWTDCTGFTVTNLKSRSLTKAANATTGTATLTRVIGCTFEDCMAGGGRYALVGCDSTVFTGTVYYDNIASTTAATIPMYVWDLITAPSYNMKFDGLSFGGLPLVQPYSGVLNLGVAGCNNIKLRSLGTAAAPLDMGGPMVDATWTRATTTMTVTKVAHGLKAGDTIAVNMCSDVAPKAVTTTTATLWSVLAAPTADTFTATVLNAGQTAGQNLRYYPTMAGVLVGFATGAAANGVYIQRCYVPHLRTGVLASSADNSSKNIYLEDVWGTEWGVQANPLLNCFVRQLQSTPLLTFQTSTYGTHFIDFYTTAQPASTSGVSWSRSTTTCTVTSSNHGLRVGDQVLVTATSDAAAVVLGVKTLTQITAVASPVNVGNTFQFTCLNAGAASGTLTFTPINGRVAVQMNEATAETSNQVALSGGAGFTSTGALALLATGRTAEFTIDEPIRGHGSFPNVQPVINGGTANANDVTYSLDAGASWHNLFYNRTGGGGASASTNVTMTSTVGVEAGDYVYGTGIAPMAQVVSITNATTVVVSIANTGTVSGVLVFNHLPSETVASSAAGFPLKIKVAANQTNGNNSIQAVYFFTNANATDRWMARPLRPYRVRGFGL